MKEKIVYGNADMLVLKLLETDDMYGYQIIDVLEKQSNEIFKLSAGSLYPLLHNLENKNYIESYEGTVSNTPGKKRKYYHITEDGKKFLIQKCNDWSRYSCAINNILFSGGDMANESV